MRILHGVNTAALRGSQGNLASSMPPNSLIQLIGGNREIRLRQRTPVISRARSERPSSGLLHPDGMPYGDRSRTASMRWILPFSILNISASSQVHGVVGPRAKDTSAGSCLMNASRNRSTVFSRQARSQVEFCARALDAA